MIRLEWEKLSELEKSKALERAAMDDSTSRSAQVSDILNEVFENRDAGVLAESERIEGRPLGQLRAVSDEAPISVELEQSIRIAYKNILAFHEKQLVPSYEVETSPGVRCRRVKIPIQKVGLYVPGGSAPLLSTALMLGVPAQLANCETRILCTPADKTGRVSSAILFAAGLCGIEDVFMVGGAQAIAAMARGTESIPKVEKIFGPGNAWVTEAKQQVSAMAGGPAIDMPAGPSEVMVLWDGSTPVSFVASDLLSQAEHGPDSDVVCLLVDKASEEALESELELQLSKLNRNDIAKQSIARARLIRCARADLMEVANRYAPEHLIIQTKDCEALSEQVRNAGSVFVGAYTPESLGDYASGTNHVLPTYGYAKTYSGVGVESFMRSMTFQQSTEAGLRAIGSTVMSLADFEGLQAHKNAVAIRLGEEV